MKETYVIVVMALIVLGSCSLHPPDLENRVLHPVGEFNSSKIRIKDGYVEHWLNGIVVVDYFSIS